jgi:hypothetical protein
MKEKEADMWAQQYIRKRQDPIPLNIQFLTLAVFLANIKAAFKQENQESDAIFQMEHLQQGTQKAEEYILRFKFLMGQADLKETEDSQFLITLFRRGITQKIKDMLLFNINPLKTITEWFTRSAECDVNLRKAYQSREQDK